MNVELAPGLWYGPEKGYVMLAVPGLEPLPIELDGVALHPKTEYHCSLVAARKFAGGVLRAEADMSLIGVDELVYEEGHLEAEVVNVVCEYVRRHTLQFDGFTGGLYVCRKPDETGEPQTTVVAVANVLGLKGLVATLRSEFPQFPDTFAHVTALKSANSVHGIGVNTPANLEAYCVRRDDLFPWIFPGLPVLAKR